MKFYEYAKCSTCVKARKYLQARGARFTTIPIIEQPPSIAEITRMLDHLKTQGRGLKDLFNTSGGAYRELAISDKLKAGLTEKEALKLLSQNGKLIKRPFLLTDDNGTVGFRTETWDRILKKSC